MMNYTSISFYLFLLVVLAVYYAVPFSFRWAVLLSGSVAFYFFAYKTGWWVLLASVLLTYAAGICIEFLRERDTLSLKRIKRAFFISSLALTALPWFCVKNGDFILGSILHRTSPPWIVPLGISFYTLQMAAYLADIYTGKIHAQKNPAKYMLFVLFFPHIGKYGCSYLAVVSDGTIMEQADGQELDAEGTVRGGRVMYDMTSAGNGCGNTSSIKIDGKEYSKNGRGLNFVVYNHDTKKIVDAVCFDTYEAGSPAAR